MSESGAHCCPEPIGRHVRSWRKQTLHRHCNMWGGSAHRRAGGRDRGLAAAGLGARRGANRRLRAVGFTRGEDRPMSAFGGRRHAGAERGVRVWTRSGPRRPSSIAIVPEALQNFVLIHCNELLSQESHNTFLGRNGDELSQPISAGYGDRWTIAAARAMCRSEATRKFQARSPDPDRISWTLLP
jgi:hypothetical protein